MAPIRLLLVDDNEDLRFLVRTAVEARGGFEVVGEAPNGREGVSLASSLQPDVVLLDLDMPSMGGLEALPLVREAAPSSKVIVLSSFRREDFEQAVRAGGAVGYLEKGITARRLVDELLAVTGLLELVEGVVAEVKAGLQADTSSASRARRFVDEVLSRWRCDDLLDDVQLLVSELVTNAVVHAGSEVEIAVRLLADSVRIEVVDTASGAPLRPSAPAAEDESGRGLLLVETLASAWGVEPLEGGKAVWFEVPRLDRSEPIS
ncbi:MAG TPA: response regulator [Acidimicrobiales bacterium]|nr:response regulator [Acidimicrobiales bacterium]